jgi:hypothetical protein
MVGSCDSRTLCVTGVDANLPPGYIVLISAGVLIAVAIAALGGYVGWKIFHSGNAVHHGGAAQDFAAE